MNEVVESKVRPAFGVKVERFLPLGYHPGFETRPGTFKNPKLFPGHYNLSQPRKVICQVTNWKRQLELEDLSKKLSYRNYTILKSRDWNKSVNGPGWHEIPPCTWERGVTFSKSVRHSDKKLKSFAVPGPGTYGKNHVPHTVLEEKSHAKGFSHSIVPPFEQSRCGPRALRVQPSYHLPPNLYKLKSSTDELLSKRISKRGPYDLFTEDRFPVRGPTGGGHFKMNLSDLYDWSKDFKGKFLRCGKDSIIISRFVLNDISLAPKNPLDPGPSYYNPYPPPKIVKSKYPFSSSVRNVRPYVKCLITGCPGRYSIETKRKIIGEGMKSAFISKTKRELPRAEKFSWFE